MMLDPPAGNVIGAYLKIIDSIIYTRDMKIGIFLSQLRNIVRNSLNI